MRRYASLWVLMRPFRCLCVFMDSNVSLWVHIGLYASLLVLIGPYMFLRVLMGLYVSLLVLIRPFESVSCCGSLCVLELPCGS